MRGCMEGSFLLSEKVSIQSCVSFLVGARVPNIDLSISHWTQVYGDSHFI